MLACSLSFENQIFQNHYKTWRSKLLILSVTRTLFSDNAKHVPRSQGLFQELCALVTATCLCSSGAYIISPQFFSFDGDRVALLLSRFTRGKYVIVSTRRARFLIRPRAVCKSPEKRRARASSFSDEREKRLHLPMQGWVSYYVNELEKFYLSWVVCQRHYALIIIDFAVGLDICLDKFYYHGWPGLNRPLLNFFFFILTIHNQMSSSAHGIILHRILIFFFWH